MGLVVSGSKKRVIPTWRDVGVSEVEKIGSKRCFRREVAQPESLNTPDLLTPQL